MDYIRAIIGLAVLIIIAYLISGNKKKIDWRLVGVGVLLQVIIAILIAEVGFVQQGFTWISEQFVTFLGFALNGAEFL